MLVFAATLAVSTIAVGLVIASRAQLLVELMAPPRRLEQAPVVPALMG
jgi:hypothetical protein